MTQKNDQSPDPRLDIARNNLRMAVALRNTNSSEVSRQAGMSRNGLGQFLSGRTTLSYGNMLLVCDVLKLPVGLVHRADAITANRIRLYQALERMPDHLAQQAVDAAQSTLGQQQ